MSFICGLSTMATLMELPFDLEPPPPHPATTAPTMPTTTTRAAADQRPLVPLISPSSCFARRTQVSSECGTYTWVYVGCQDLLCALRKRKTDNSRLVAWRILCLYVRHGPSADQPPGGPARGGRPPGGSGAALPPRGAETTDRPRRSRRLPPCALRSLRPRAGGGRTRLGRRRPWTA